MERFTVRYGSEEPTSIPNENAIYMSDEFGAKCWEGDAINKLADYEDTGFTPEEILTLRAERDEAIKDILKIMKHSDSPECVVCQYCKKENNCIGECKPMWRGVEIEYE